MAIVYEWVVSQMECHSEKNKKKQVVSRVYWRYAARDGEYYADVYGSQHLDTDNLKGFVPYANLTKEQVIGWLETTMGEKKIADFQASLKAAIEEMKEPKVVTPPLPWSN
jgi:hypothetical protein